MTADTVVSTAEIAISGSPAAETQFASGHRLAVRLFNPCSGALVWEWPGHWGVAWDSDECCRHGRLETAMANARASREAYWAARGRGPLGQ